MIELWTDGACSGNPGPGGWAYVIVYPDGTRAEGSGGDPDTTNNRMELLAAIEGLKAIATPSQVQIVTDSAYVSDAFLKNWVAGWERRGWQRAGKKGKPTPLKNPELWRALTAEVRRHQKVDWRRVRGHVGHDLNERCDQLAVAATLRAGGDPKQMVELGGRRQSRPRTDSKPSQSEDQLRVFNADNLDTETRKRYGFD